MTEENKKTEETVNKLGNFISDNHKSIEAKINEIDDNVKKAKTAANLAATVAGIVAIVGGGIFVYDRMHAAPTAGEMF